MLQRVAPHALLLPHAAPLAELSQGTPAARAIRCQARAGHKSFIINDQVRANLQLQFELQFELVFDSEFAFKFAKKVCQLRCGAPRDLCHAYKMRGELHQLWGEERTGEGSLRRSHKYVNINRQTPKSNCSNNNSPRNISIKIKIKINRKSLKKYSRTKVK